LPFAPERHNDDFSLAYQLLASGQLDEGFSPEKCMRLEILISNKLKKPAQLPTIN